MTTTKKRKGITSLKQKCNENYLRYDVGDVSFIFFEGDRANKYIKTLYWEVAWRRSNRLISELVVTSYHVNENSSGHESHLGLHYAGATINVDGYRNNINTYYEVLTAITGESTAREKAESKLIEITGDDLQEHH